MRTFVRKYRIKQNGWLLEKAILFQVNKSVVTLLCLQAFEDGVMTKWSQHATI